MDINNLTRWQALDVVGQVGKAIELGLIGTAVELLGLSEELAEELTLQEVTQIVAYRFSVIAKRAGVAE